jgi:hypothetical protein
MDKDPRKILCQTFCIKIQHSICWPKSAGTSYTKSWKAPRLFMEVVAARRCLHALVALLLSCPRAEKTSTDFLIFLSMHVDRSRDPLDSASLRLAGSSSSVPNEKFVLSKSMGLRVLSRRRINLIATAEHIKSGQNIRIEGNHIQTIQRNREEGLRKQWRSCKVELA